MGPCTTFRRNSSLDNMFQTIRETILVETKICYVDLNPQWPLVSKGRHNRQLSVVILEDDNCHSSQRNRREARAHPRKAPTTPAASPTDSTRGPVPLSPGRLGSEDLLRGTSL